MLKWFEGKQANELTANVVEGPEPEHANVRIEGKKQHEQGQN